MRYLAITAITLLLSSLSYCSYHGDSKVVLFYQPDPYHGAASDVKGFEIFLLSVSRQVHSELADVRCVWLHRVGGKEESNRCLVSAVLFPGRMYVYVENGGW